MRARRYASCACHNPPRDESKICTDGAFSVLRVNYPVLSADQRSEPLVLRGFAFENFIHLDAFVTAVYVPVIVAKDRTEAVGNVSTTVTTFGHTFTCKSMLKRVLVTRCPTQTATIWTVVTHEHLGVPRGARDRRALPRRTRRVRFSLPGHESAFVSRLAVIRSRVASYRELPRSARPDGLAEAGASCFHDALCRNRIGSHRQRSLRRSFERRFAPFVITRERSAFRTTLSSG